MRVFVLCYVYILTQDTLKMHMAMSDQEATQLELERAVGCQLAH